MKNRLEYWKTLEGIGRLYKEIDLIIANDPLLFVCRRKTGDSLERFLVMTYDVFENEYVCIRISDRALTRMLRNQVTMEESFRNADQILLTYGNKGILHFNTYTASEFPSEKLPRKGAYYELDYPYIMEYISMLERKRGQLCL